MATTDSPLFPRDLGKEIGVAWLGPLPTSPGTFRAGPRGTSGSIVAVWAPQVIHHPQTWKVKESSF